jgi:hypothetical protein
MESKNNKRRSEMATGIDGDRVMRESGLEVGKTLVGGGKEVKVKEIIQGNDKIILNFQDKDYTYILSHVLLSIHKGNMTVKEG